MRQLILIAATAATFATGAAQAHYIPVAAGKTELASSITNTTVAGQSFSQTFGLDGKSYSDISFTLYAKGDYGLDSTENIAFYLDDILLGTWSASKAPYSKENSAEYDYTLYGAVSVSETQWAAIAADKFMTVSWKNSASVKPYNANTTLEGGQDFVSFSVQGTLKPATTQPQPGNAVPEPGTLALFGLGLIGVGMLRRRRN